MTLCAIPEFRAAEELAQHANSPHTAFWRSLQPGYQQLERQRQL